MSAGNASPPPPARTKKSVRIESPTSSSPHAAANTDYESPSNLYRGNDAGHPGPKSPAGFSDRIDGYASSDTYERAEGGGIAREARDITGSKRRDSDMESPMHSLSGAPMNPFSKTLATIEPQEKGRVEPAHVGQQRGALNPFVLCVVPG